MSREEVFSGGDELNAGRAYVGFMMGLIVVLGGAVGCGGREAEDTQAPDVVETADVAPAAVEPAAEAPVAVEPQSLDVEVRQAVKSSIESVQDTVAFLTVMREEYNQGRAIVTLVVDHYSDVDRVVLALRKHTIAQGGTLFESVATRMPRVTREGRIQCPLEITLVSREGSAK